MLDSGFVRDLFEGLMRHAATASGGFLAAHGLLTGNQLSGWIGSVCFLGGIAWSAWDKYQRSGNI
jgi:hypothetical protein